MFSRKPDSEMPYAYSVCDNELSQTALKWHESISCEKAQVLHSYFFSLFLIFFYLFVIYFNVIYNMEKHHFRLHTESKMKRLPST